MIFKLLSSKYSSKTQSELVSLITEPLSFENNSEQFSSIPIENNEENSVNEQDKHEIGSNQVCRICYSSGDLQSLINPCNCSGTMGILHKNCLERWLEISNTTKCEICQQDFEVIRHPKSLFYFLIHPLHSSDIRYLINDIILFIFLTAIISWLSIINLAKIRSTRTFYDGLSYILLPLCVFIIYVIWCWVSFRYHIQIIKEWRSMNQLIHVINNKQEKIFSNPSFTQSTTEQEHSHILTSENEENIISDIHIIS